LVESLKGNVFGGGSVFDEGEDVFDEGVYLRLVSVACRLRKGVFWIVSLCKSAELKGIYRPWARVAGEWWHTIHLPVH
jgi:hypothetical protein